VDQVDDVRRGAARLLASLLDAVDRGDLDAGSAHGHRMLRRIEGAVIALDPGYQSGNGESG
jgi:hypothetical protein